MLTPGGSDQQPNKPAASSDGDGRFPCGLVVARGYPGAARAPLL